MVVKRTKRGNTTITINTKTGRQTTSRRAGNITYSQSNQGHNRTTVTTNYGNGWFDRKTTNWNKKPRKKKSKSSWSWLWKSRKITTYKSSSIEAVEHKPEFVGPPYPVFWARKKFKQFTLSEWILWCLAFPFRLAWWSTLLITLIVMIQVVYKVFTL